MPKLKPGTITPTAAEDAEIDRQIAADPDDFELTDEWFAKARPAAEVFEELGVEMPRPRGRGPQKEPTKEPVAVRLDPDVLGYFRATGKGWQTRMNSALKEWIREHGA